MKPLPSPSADTPTLDQLSQAALRLQAGSRPAWGKLDAPRMLEHCSRFIDLYLGRVPVSAGVRLAARWLGPPFLRRMVVKSPIDTPRNLRTLGSLQPGSLDSARFADSVERLRRGLGEMAALEGAVYHVLYGSTDAESIRSLVRHHTAHHFHQFGLLTDR